MTFVRKDATSWHREVPGARWFKADLHLHTIDDHAGGRAKLPRGLSGEPGDPANLAAYAKMYLRAAIDAGIQVLGITPHSPRVGTAPETSAVWHIVETWNSGDDDDGTPFRDKIYAVFPGFEPNVNDGRSGVHLLFLFDPEIGRDAYLRVFDAMMDGGNPWAAEGLRLTPKSAKEVFQTFDQRRNESKKSDGSWDYMVLAPHFQGDHGLLNALKSQALAKFPCAHLAGYELKDGGLPEDFSEEDAPGSYLLPSMKKHRQAFFHASDAYDLAAGNVSTRFSLGHRYTWAKMASPRIEALRQAFVSSDSRMRIGFRRDESGKLCEINDPPDVTLNKRPWLKSVTVRGGTSFFGGHEQGVPRATTFELSPDLTCLIGGSMTGKSTLLDGLRVHAKAPLPKDDKLKSEVQERGADRFLAGSAEVEFDCPGADQTAQLHKQWPAVFFAQKELQRLSEDEEEVENILARLVPSETDEIETRQGQLDEADKALEKMAKRLAELDEQLDDAEQAHQRSARAKKELDAFSEAGVAKLHQAGRARRLWQSAREKAGELTGRIQSIRSLAAALDEPDLDETTGIALKAVDIDLATLSLSKRRERVLQALESAQQDLTDWWKESSQVQEAVAAHEAKLSVEVEHKLAKQGFNASKLKEFQQLSKQASLLASYEANLGEVRDQLRSEEGRFAQHQKDRRTFVADQRLAFDRVMNEIEHNVGRGIRSRRQDDGDSDPLLRFVRELSQKGISRWWNSLNDGDRPSPETVLEHLENGTLADVGMTAAVQQTFAECMTKRKRRELAALRCPDLYALEFRVDDDNYRRLDELSGGQRVSVLLSLLLETTDNRPLVIDQPEDELDNRFLFDTVLPALKKLKGRRQVIMATHNANIVVNGDADMVIQLEATADQGHVAHAGVIEETAVRDAILRTVDGGDEAFRLRLLKYGF